MNDHVVSFKNPEGKGSPVEVRVPSGSLISEAALVAGLEIGQPCGGQGRCGRCVLQVKGSVRRRSTLRLSEYDIKNGFALACQTIIDGDVEVIIPNQEQIERRLTSDRVISEIKVPSGYDFHWSQSIRIVELEMIPPSIDDQTDDWNRLKLALKLKTGVDNFSATLNTYQVLGKTLREGIWKVTAILDKVEFSGDDEVRIIGLEAGFRSGNEELLSCAIDIGTTTVTVLLVDLITGKVKTQESEYNGQISRGEDVISRIVYSGKERGGIELQEKVVDTINKIIEQACAKLEVNKNRIYKVVVTGNSTMIHLLLGIPASSIRFSPYITAVNQPPIISAKEIGINIYPDAIVDCLPGIASYVGADITSGVYSSGMYLKEDVSLFIDVGTNGEIVLGNQDWLVSCACSAGPAFEGAGVVAGMRATVGAIEEVWVNNQDFEPTVRIIGGGKPKGICGSGLISLLAELFLAGIVDKAGNINTTIKTSRIREGDRGGEYILAWANETENGRDITITRVDIDNLLRAKAAIFAGFNVLTEQIGIKLEDVKKILIGGSFGKYINIEKAIQIGLLPDVAWDKFVYLGNTSVRGAYQALLSKEARRTVQEIANRMTYIELSADNTFYEAFMSALFLPHTDLDRFPSVKSALNNS